MLPSLKYLWYMIRHKWFVLIECWKTGLYWQGLVHDWQKFSPTELFPIALYYFGPWQKGQHPEWLLEQKKIATHHHFRYGPHHWQHWVLVDDQGQQQVLEMPERFAREMLADWRGVGYAKHGYDDSLSFYSENRDKIILHPSTRQFVERELGRSVEKVLPNGAVVN